MYKFAIATWVNEKLVSYEPLLNRSVDEVLAYGEGMVTERVNPSRSDPALPGVTYVLEVGHRDVNLTPHFNPEAMVGAWFITDVDGRSGIVWQAKIHDRPECH